VPGLGADAAAIHAVGPEKAEALHVGVEPGREPAEDAVARVFGRHKLNDVARRHAGHVDDVDVAAPVMAAAAGDRRPAQDGVDGLRVRELAPLDLAALPVVERPLAGPLAVPDRQLRVEVAEAGASGQVDAIALGRIAHRQKGGGRFVVQSAARLGQLHDMGARSSGQLELVHPASLTGNSGSIAKTLSKKPT